MAFLCVFVLCFVLFVCLFCFICLLLLLLLACHMGIHTPSSEDVSLFVKGGCCYTCSSSLIVAEDNSHIHLGLLYLELIVADDNPHIHLGP